MLFSPILRKKTSVQTYLNSGGGMTFKRGIGTINGFARKIAPLHLIKKFNVLHFYKISHDKALFKV